MTRQRTLLFVPCFNEEGRIGSLLRRIAGVETDLAEVVVVDDGSTDHSPQEIVDSAAAFDGRLSVLRHPDRLGLGEGFRTAYRHALARGHESFCVMAGNGKDDPEDLPAVLAPIHGDEADYVQGSRFQPGGLSERLPFHRDLAIRGFTVAASIVCRRRFHDCSNGFRAYRVALLNDERIDWCAPWLGSSYQVEIHLLLSAVRLGYRVVEVPVRKVYPADGRPYSKAAPRDWFRMAAPLLRRAAGADRLSGPRRAPGHAEAGRVQELLIAGSV